MNDQRASYIQTHTGVRFRPYAPRAIDINIDDIAHSLSMQCRFNGHTKEFYSVAQHSVFVSKLVRPRAKLWALMHDAAEAYVADLATPIKRHMPQYIDMEDNIHEKVIERFDIAIDDVIHADVKNADRWMLVQEAKQLMEPDEAFDEIEEGLANVVFINNYKKMEIGECWSPAKAKTMFLIAYRIYTNDATERLHGIK